MCLSIIKAGAVHEYKPIIISVTLIKEAPLGLSFLPQPNPKG